MKTSVRSAQVPINAASSTGHVAKNHFPTVLMMCTTIFIPNGLQYQTFRTPNSLDTDVSPPPKIPYLLRQLNQECKALIIKDLNDQTKVTLPNEEEILNHLRAAGWQELPSNKWTAYGEIRKVKFDLNVDHDSALLLVSTQLPEQYPG